MPGSIPERVGFRPEGNAVANGCRSQTVDGVGGLQVEPGLFGVEDEPPVTGEPSKEASNQAIQQVLEALPGWRANAMEPRPAVLPGVDTVEHQHVQVDIQVQGAAEALNEGDDAGPCAIGGFQARALGQVLLPVSLRDWLPEDHLAYFVAEMIEELDLTPFYAPYMGDGRRKMPYEPSMMLKVLVYAYISGVFSSRKIARKLEEDVAFRVLGAGNFPSHRTICDFRKRHLKDFKALFMELVRLAREAGLVSLGTLAVDGTKLRANASKHKAMSYARMQQEERRLSDEIASMCRQAGYVDDAEDARFGADRRGDEVPDELAHRESRLEKIRAAKARLEAEQSDKDTARGRHKDDDRRPPGGRGKPYKRDFGVPDEKAQSNFTDPESRIMKTADGYQQCYNGQVAVDGDFQLIVANALTANASDQGVMLGLLDEVGTTLEACPESLLADAGYRKEDDLQVLESREIDAYVSIGREGKKAGEIDAERYPATERMQRKLASADGKARYRERKHVVEAANGWIKHVMGFRRFSIRGQQGASGEWDLVCLAVNLRRMSRLIAWT